MHTVPEILIERAQAEGLGHFFGLPSSGVLLELLEAGRRCGVDFVSSAHESSGAISAAYYGYFKGCAGLAIGIQGPGAGNMASGAVNAQYERKPVVCVCECPAAGDYGNWGQQGDHRAMFKSAVRARWRIDAENTAQAAYEAFRQAGQLRLGPVLLELPRNLGQSEGNATWTPVADVPLTDPDPRALDALVEMVASFRRPVIIAGDDVRRAGLIPQLAALAAVLKAAVLVTMDARGVYDETDPRFGCVYIGTQPPHALYRSFLQEADGVLIVGADGRMKEARWDVDVPVAELVVAAEFPALSDAPWLRVDGCLAPSLARLAALDNEKGFPVEQIAELRRGVHSRFVRPAEARLAVNDLIAIAREQLPDDGLVFAETGVFQSMLEHSWPVRVPDTFFGSTVGRTMGLTIPALLGARLACPQRPMLGFTTDGSALMRLGDLETMARAGAAAPLIVANDGALGTIRAQQRYKGLDDYGLALSMVDFAAVAQAVGLHGVRVDTPEGFAVALREALVAERATVIDARVDPQAYRDSFMATTGIVP